VESLGSITTRKFRLSGMLGVEREPLIESPATSQTETEVRGFLDHSHLTEGILVGTDRKVAAILVFFDPQLQSIEQMRTIVDGVEATVKHNPPPAGYEAFMTGQAVLRVDIVRNLQSDQRSLIPLAGLLYFIALFLAYRRVSGSVVPLLAVGVGLAWTLGLFAVTGQSFNLISNVLPMLLLVLGVSKSVHIISRYAEQSLAEPIRQRAVFLTMKHMAVACFLTFITTAAGFASLGTAQSDLLRSFGWQAVAGLIFLYFSIVITLSAALPWLRPPVVDAGNVDRPGLLRRWLARLGRGVTNRPKLTLASSFALMALALFAARDVKINSYTLETYDDSHPTLKTIRLVERRLSGLFPLEIDLKVDDPDRFYDADFIKQLAEVQRYAAAQKEVVFERSYLNLHAEVEPTLRELLLSKPKGQLPTLQQDIRYSQTRLRTVAEEIGYSAFMTPDKLRARLLLKVRDEGTYRTRELIDRLDAKLRDTFPEGSGVQFQMTGEAYVITRAMDRLIRDLMTSLITASAVIFLIIGLLFRSLRVGLIAALPNTTPLLLTLGYMGWRGYDMNAGNVIVFTISLGIAVDDTIHLLYRFREEHHTQPNVVQATRSALAGTGPAIVLTSLLIVGGLAVLLFSQFVPTRRFAELLIVTMGGALVGDLLLLPACLVLFSAKQKPDSKELAGTPDSRTAETSECAITVAMNSGQD
jgi:predicted RND superfamily exporter protein